jgi:hypothetical protein
MPRCLRVPAYVVTGRVVNSVADSDSPIGQWPVGVAQAALNRLAAGRSRSCVSVRAAGLARFLDLDEVTRMDIVNVTVNGNFPGNERMFANATNVINHT